MPLQGNYHVYPTATAISKAWKLCNGMREYQILRRHGLKLAFWPSSDGGEPDADLDWDWIQTLKQKRIGEMRIDEKINSHRNIRIIFFVPTLTIENDPVGCDGKVMKRLWLLTVFPKKRNHFTKHELKAFAASRDLIVERHYHGLETT